MAAAEAQIARLDAVHEARMAEAKKRRDKAMEFLDPTENANVFWQVRESVPQPLLLEQNNQSGWGVVFRVVRVRDQGVLLSPSVPFALFSSSRRKVDCAAPSPPPLTGWGCCAVGHSQPPSSQTPTPWWLAET